MIVPGSYNINSKLSLSSLQMLEGLDVQFGYALGFFLSGLLLLFSGWLFIGRMRSQALRKHLNPRPAKDLFLNCKIKKIHSPYLHKQGVEPESDEQLPVYLRSLNMMGAMVVSSEELKKSTQIEFNLGSLPGFPEQKGKILSEVISCKPFESSSGSFLVGLKYSHKMKEDIKRSIAEYLQILDQTRSTELR